MNLDLENLSKGAKLILDTYQKPHGGPTVTLQTRLPPDERDEIRTLLDQFPGVLREIEYEKERGTDKYSNITEAGLYRALIRIGLDTLNALDMGLVDRYPLPNEDPLDQTPKRRAMYDKVLTAERDEAIQPTPDPAPEPQPDPEMSEEEAKQLAEQLFQRGVKAQTGEE